MFSNDKKFVSVLLAVYLTNPAVVFARPPQATDQGTAISLDEGLRKLNACEMGPNEAGIERFRNSPMDDMTYTMLRLDEHGSIMDGTRSTFLSRLDNESDLTLDLDPSLSSIGENMRNRVAQERTNLSGRTSGANAFGEHCTTNLSDERVIEADKYRILSDSAHAAWTVDHKSMLTDDTTMRATIKQLDRAADSSENALKESGKSLDFLYGHENDAGKRSGGGYIDRLEALKKTHGHMTPYLLTNEVHKLGMDLGVKIERSGGRVYMSYVATPGNLPLTKPFVSFDAKFVHSDVFESGLNDQPFNLKNLHVNSFTNVDTIRPGSTVVVRATTGTDSIGAVTRALHALDVTCLDQRILAYANIRDLSAAGASGNADQIRKMASEAAKRENEEQKRRDAVAKVVENGAVVNGKKVPGLGKNAAEFNKEYMKGYDGQYSFNDDTAYQLGLIKEKPVHTPTPAPDPKVQAMVDHWNSPEWKKEVEDYRKASQPSYDRYLKEQAEKKVLADAAQAKKDAAVKDAADARAAAAAEKLHLTEKARQDAVDQAALDAKNRLRNEQAKYSAKSGIIVEENEDGSFNYVSAKAQNKRNNSARAIEYPNDDGSTTAVYVPGADPHGEKAKAKAKAKAEEVASNSDTESTGSLRRKARLADEAAKSAAAKPKTQPVGTVAFSYVADDGMKHEKVRGEGGKLFDRVAEKQD